MLEVPSHSLPTLPSLGITSLPDSISSSAPQIAQKWLSDLESALSSSKPDLSNLLVEDSFWRDMLALTWDFRTFNTIPSISSMLVAQVPKAHPRNFKLRQELLGLQQPYPDVAWVHLMFDFETDEGVCFGIARLVPVPAPASKGGLDWKAHVVFTNLEALKGFPEKIGSLRNHAFNHGLWEAQRKREREFRDGNPQVLIIGAGQSGLELAARLKALDVSTLLVERNERIGDNWRKRYEALCLHDPVWYDHMPYLPFPPTWPVYTPAMKLADWLESYAHHMELNVWTSSTITSVSHKPNGKWDVEITTKEGEKRKFEVNHVVFATGLGSGVPNTPKYPGMDEFKGEILHSSEHKRALDHAGKKVLVVGACTSAHDIAVDYYNHGVDVTMFQRSSTYIMSCKNGWKVLFEGVYSENAPPVDIADRLNASYPHYMSVGLNQRRVQTIAEMDKEILDGLNKVGFRTNFGIEGSGFGLLAWSKAGGYYLDTGASKLISEGKIKLKNDALIESFTPSGIKFDNGETMDVDVVVFATGLGDPVEHIRRLCGSSVADKCGPIWGLDKEGEINGVWRDLGVKGLWYMMGNLALCRFHSKHVALQIKAIEEGVLKERYGA